MRLNMFDKMTFILDRFSPDELKALIIYIGLRETPKSTKNKLYFFWGNLKFEYFHESQKLWIRNSWHKFNSAIIRDPSIGEANYNDFTYSDFRNTAKFICKALNRSIHELIVLGELEYGVNINVFPFEPMYDIADSYISFGNRAIPFYAHPAKKGKAIGKSAYLHEYRVKFYDKSRQAQVPQKGILRYEICNYSVGKLKRSLKMGIVTLYDLMQIETHKVLAKDLLDTFDKIKVIPSYKDSVSTNEMLKILRYVEPIMMKFDKRLLSEYKYNKLRSEGKELMNSYSTKSESIHNWVRNKIETKLEYLINPPSCNIRGGINDVITNKNKQHED